MSLHRSRWHRVLLLILAVSFLPSLLHTQTDRSGDRAWSRINLPPPGPAQVLVDNPSRTFPSTLKVGTLPPQDSPDVQVTASTTVTQSENSIFISPLNNLLILNSNNSSDYPITQIYGASGFVSTDGGLTWTGSVQGTGGNNSGDPAVAIDLNGRFYNNYIAADGGNGTAYSTNNGSTWTHVQVTPIPGPGGLADKNHMWVDNSPSSAYQGNLYASWTDFEGATDSEIMVSRSTNAGLNWSAKAAVSTAINAGSHNQGVNVQTGPNGEVYATWAVYDSWPALETALGFAKSTNGGASWQPAVRAIPNIKGIRNVTGGGLLGGKDMRTASFPSMSVNMQNGHIYIVWANIGVPGVNTGTERDIYMAKSTNGGTTWGTPVRVNQDTFNNGKDQWFPWIACDPVSGALVVVFYDSRDFSANDQANTYAAVSYDGGSTWEDFRVSDASWSGDGSGTGFSSNYAGDYIGVAVRNGRAIPVWTDRRASGGRLSAWVSPFLIYPPNAGFVKGTVTSGGSPLTGVLVDFTNPVTQIPSTTDPTGYYKANAAVEPGTTSLLTIRAQKFGYVTKTDTVTVVRADTVTRNISLVTAPGGTLRVRSYRTDSTNIRAAVQVSFGGQVVVSDSTDPVTGLLTVPLPTGSYDVVVDPPSPYGTRSFTGVTITASQTTNVNAIVRFVLEPSPTAMRDTLAVGQTRAKTLNLLNTTADSVSFRITDDNALRMARVRVPGKPVKVYDGYELAKGVVDTREGIGGVDGRGGPDAFGYQWVDSDEPGGPAFAWVDVSGIGTPITGWLGTSDDGRKVIAMPFSFPFYGATYDSVKVTTNGWISFATTSTNNAYSNTAIPASAEPNNAVYMFWDDLNLTSSGSVHSYNDVANGRFIIQYTNVPHYGTAEPGVYTFQVHLYPNGNMLFQYLNMQQTLNSATIGIENANGSTGLQVVFNNTYVHNNLAIRFFLPDAPWISENPVLGTIPPGGNRNITVTFDATGLVTGQTYTGTIFIDPDHPDVLGTIDVPASLKIQLANQAVLILNKSTVTFPATQINTTRRDTIVAKNGGATTLTISSITRTNTDFSVSPASAVLSPGDSVLVPVVYTPTAVGPDTGRVIFLSNSQGTPRIDVILDGTAIGAPVISVVPAGLSDTLQAGMVHSKTFTITNTATPPATPLLVTLSESLGWLAVNPAADTLEAGTGASFTVTFTANVPIGTYTGTITIASNDPATPGTGVACTLRVTAGPVIGITPASLIRTLPPNAQRTDTLVIKNTGAMNLTWALAEVPAPEPAEVGHYYQPGPELPKGVDDGRSAGPGPEGSGGPDGFGYRWIDSNEPGGPVFNWVDITGTGTALDSTSAWVPTGTWRGGDEGYYPVRLPFTFPYYGVGKDSVFIGTNGLVLFQRPTGNTFTNTIFPTAGGTSDNALGVFWDDMEVRGRGRVYYGPSGINFVILYKDMPEFGDSTADHTFQVILKPTGEWVYQYLTMGAGGGSITSASVGMENAGGTIGLSVVHNASYVQNNLAVSFGRGVSWLEESPLAGSIVPGDSALVTVVMNSTGLPQGVYNGILQFSSNDLTQNPRDVSVQMTVGSSGTLSVGVGAGWNMISNPVTTAQDSVRQLFSTSSFPYAFSFAGASGYQQRYRMVNGVGYWAKFPAATTEVLTGTARTLDTVEVLAGWNLVGSIASPVDTSTIVELPAGLRSPTSYWYGYSGSYTAAATLQPGKGYWIKANMNGAFVFTAGPAPEKAGSPGTDVTAAMNWVTIRDAAGRSQTLYFGAGEREYEMPPLPPEGAFDARFETQNGGAMMKGHEAGASLPIGVHSAVAPVTVSWTVKSGRYMLDAGQGPNPMAGEGALTLRGPVSRLVLHSAKGAEIPTAFSLMQNYPNPFNPTTTIRFGLPVASRVRLEVYNLLGQRVGTLVEDLMMEAGYRTVEWNGAGAAGQQLGSGVYLLRLSADGPEGKSFTDTRKMILMR